MEKEAILLAGLLAVISVCYPEWHSDVDRWLKLSYQSQGRREERSRGLTVENRRISFSLGKAPRLPLSSRGDATFRVN